MVKSLPVQTRKETGVQSLRQEDPLEEGTVALSSVLAWRIPMDRGVHGVTQNWTPLKRYSIAQHT